MCLDARAAGGRQDDSRRVAIEVSPLRLPLLPRDPLPPEPSWGGETRILTKLAFTFLGGCSPRLVLADRSLLLCFYFWRAVPCNCPEHMLLSAHTHTPPSHQPPAKERVPLFCIYLFLPLSLLKVREWRRPISARLPFCEFNSEAPGLREDAVAAPSASRVGRPRRGSRLAGAS